MKQREIKRKKKRNGFILIRETNHLVFKHIVTGKLITTPKSPRNNKYYSKVLDRQLKKSIGMTI